MPCGSIGRTEFTEDEKKANEKETQETYEYFFGKNKLTQKSAKG